MLDIQLLNVFIKGAEVKKALRVRKLRKLGHRALGHCAILTEFCKALLDRDINYMAIVANFVRTVYVDVPTKENSASRCIIREDEISVFALWC